MLGTEAAWSRGILRGFMLAARERSWTSIHCHPGSDVKSLVEEWAPAVVVVGPELGAEAIARLAPAAVVSVTADRTRDRVASVCLDEARVAALVLDHLMANGLRHVSTFCNDDSPFAKARERAFIQRAYAIGCRVASGWATNACSARQRRQGPAAIIAWLRALPRPCGIFTCTDGCGCILASHAREAGLRVPEEIALVGADNDVLECELSWPPLSSVMIPWQEVGRAAEMLVQGALTRQGTAGRRLVISPIAIAARRSSDVRAVDDALVAGAVAWIRDHADRRLTVMMVARAVGSSRQRLERRFRCALRCTVRDEIRRAHVDAARHLLGTPASA